MLTHLRGRLYFIAPDGYMLNDMEFVIGFVVLVLGGLVLAGWLGFALFVSGERSQRKATENKTRFFDEAFDGRDLVTFRVNLQTPPAPVMIEGGHERGYDLKSHVKVTEGGEASDLVFIKRA